MDMTSSEIPISIEDEMKSSYMAYAMSVIAGRALPDVRDGLKPVHRRILYAMHELGASSSKPYKKSARIVGEVLGKYHPHGDMAVYDTMVRMAQDFSSRYPLIDGQGNFGSIDGDDPAAMRYTEARLSKISEEMLSDIGKDTVDLSPNFDDTLKEPRLLPAKLPNLLVNGSSGIAVGMATNIPPHNLAEVAEGVIMMIDDPDVDVDGLMEAVNGPDFPTGGFIVGRDAIKDAYSTGRGILRVRAKARIEERKGKARIIIDEIPYQLNKSKLVEEIAEQINERRIEGVSDLRDESDRRGIQIVIELRPGVNAEIILNRLYKYTQMETSFGIILLALVDGEPRELTLREIIHRYIAHRKEIITRSAKHDLGKAEKKAHILEGLKITLSEIDKIVKIIRGADTKDDAGMILRNNFGFSEEQTKAILEMKLRTLSRLERSNVEKEHRELMEEIISLKDVLSSEKNILEIMKKELLELKTKYGDKRRTEIIDGDKLNVDAIIQKEDVAITITQAGYIKRMPIQSFKRQKRGGKGVIGMEMKESDFAKDLLITSTLNWMLYFTNEGRVYWSKVHEIPEGSRHTKGKAIVNLLELKENERIMAAIPVDRFDDRYLFFATKRGIVKKTTLSSYSHPRKKGIKAIILEEDELIDVKLTDGEEDIILGTMKGKAIRFYEKDVRSMGRSTRGVKGIRLGEGDEVIGMEIAKDIILTLTENGYGKRTPIKKYRRIKRGGQGVINIKTNERNGSVVGIKKISDEDDVLIASSGGIVIRVPVKGIPVQGRNTQGVRLIRLKESERIAGVAVA
jgi:DNA gyrase subunit A